MNSFLGGQGEGPGNRPNPNNCKYLSEKLLRQSTDVGYADNPYGNNTNANPHSDVIFRAAMEAGRQGDIARQAEPLSALYPAITSTPPATASPHRFPAYTTHANPLFANPLYNPHGKCQLFMD
jgi:hypothetical protein